MPWAAADQGTIGLFWTGFSELRGRALPDAIYLSTSAKRNRLVQLPVNAAIYALRNMVERCFNKLNNARRLATRYDKTADSYLGFIHLVLIRLWMREFVNAS